MPKIHHNPFTLSVMIDIKSDMDPTNSQKCLYLVILAVATTSAKK
jgi:hypothetical protein